MPDILRPTRRGVIGGLGLLFAAPAIVKASSLMPVKAERLVVGPHLTATDVLMRYAERLINPPLVYFASDNMLKAIDGTGKIHDLSFKVLPAAKVPLC